MTTTIDKSEITHVRVHRHDNRDWLSVEGPNGTRPLCLHIDPCTFLGMVLLAMRATYGETPEPFAPNAERDAARTLGVEELRAPGASGFAATTNELGTLKSNQSPTTIDELRTRHAVSSDEPSSPVASACSTTADTLARISRVNEPSLIHASHAAVPASPEERAAAYHAQTMDFVASKLGLTL